MGNLTRVGGRALAFAIPICAFGFTKYPAQPGRLVSSPDEPIHFLAIGDWGSQPHQTFPPNGGSMHNSCAAQPDAKRCQSGSDDWKREENAQVNVMKQMLNVAQQSPISWVVNTGDNFYFDGVTSDSHWHWKSSFENMYKDSAFHVPFLSVLGNHDYGGDCCAKDLFGGAEKQIYGFVGQAHATAQFDYDTEKAWQWPAKKKNRWVMPYFNWTKVIDVGAYKVQFFAIDTNFADAPKQCLRCGGCKNAGKGPEVMKRGCGPGAASAPEGQCVCFMRKLFTEQLDWLEKELEKSAQDTGVAWRFLIGHHPWNFIPRGNGAISLDRFLLMLKKYHVQVHFAGHVHSMRHDILDGGSTQMVMTGSSGGYQYDGGNAPSGDPLGQTVWSSAFLDYGFAHLEMTKDKLKVRYINDKGDLRKTLEISASLQYRYAATPWSSCSNPCGEGLHDRQVTCERILADGSLKIEPDTSVCVQNGIAMPPTAEKCYLDRPPAIRYCMACAAGDECTQCADGFKLEGSHCVAMSGRSFDVLASLVLAAPPNDDWRPNLPEFIEHAMFEVSNNTFSVVVAAIFPAAKTSAEYQAEARRRLDQDTFVVEATVTTLQPSEPTRSAPTESSRMHAVAALRQLQSSPDAFETAAGDSGIALRSLSIGEVPCPHGQLVDDREACVPSAPGSGHIKGILFAICLLAVVAVVLALVIRSKRVSAQSVRAQEMTTSIGSLRPSTSA